MSTTKLVSYDSFLAPNLKGSEPIPKEVKKLNETIKYNDIKLSYNYGTPEEPIIQDLFFECPVVTSTGIAKKEEPNTKGKDGKDYTKTSFSMMLLFDLADPETKNDSNRALEKLDEVFSASCDAIASCKGKLKMHDFDPRRPGGSFKNPVYWHRDETTGEKVKGKNPNIWVKLRPYGNNKTIFTDLNGKPIEWSLLKDVNVTLLPLLHYEKIYVGAKASLQIFMASAIVLKIVAAGTESRQLSTIDRLKAKYGNLADQVESQLADLRMSRQETLQSSVPLPSSHTEFGSTDTSNNSGTMHPMGSPAASSASLQDFLSAAPPMNPQPTQVPLPNGPGAPQPIRLTVQPMKIN
jgi:hypothetical protein